MFKALAPLIGVLLSASSLSALAAPAQEHRAVAGLAAPAEIRIDTWGIAHIYAGSVTDAFFLQGYNVARDRLWQIDLWRKRGLGLLAKDFGPDYVAQDRATRLFLYRGDMAKEWAAYGPGAQANTAAWVAGVNAFVDEIAAGKRPLPLEFTIAGNSPDRWTPQDVVTIRSHGLTRNVPNEVGRAQIACKAGLPAARLYRHLEPKWTTQIPEGLDPCAIPADVLADYQLAGAGVKFNDSPLQTAALEVPPEALGSNNWTVAGSRTASGRPILANDPHREHSAPSLRYIVHLNAPGLSVIGAGEPALPGISIGHNDKIAFGLTIFPVDQEDLYVYDTKPGDPDQYRYGQGWEAMTVVKDAIPVKGEAVPRPIELRFTRHGPVLKALGGKAFAIRTVWGQPGTSAYFGSTGYMQAQDWQGFKTALAGWGAPSVNQAYADTSGHIGWVAAAMVPARPNWDGLMPVPGDGRYEWQGFVAADDLPRLADPKQGWFASANQMNLPKDYPYAERKLGFEWTNPARFARISQVLAAKPKLTLADAMALQTDPYDITAVRLVALLAPLTTDDLRLVNALDRLKRWNHRTAVNSPTAAIFEVWTGKHLGRAVVAAAAPTGAQALIGNGDLAAVMDLLEHPDATLPAATRDAVLKASLLAAIDELTTRLGPDPQTWTWGRLHQARFEHALTPRANPAQRARLSVGPTPMAGTSLSPMAATWRPDDFRVIAGASFRMVLDVGAWDNSMTINTPGQSGNPQSPHFADLFPKWVRGDYVPLLYSRPAVEGATETVITLTPAP